MGDQMISDFMKLGCKTERDAAVVLQVYLELCEVKRYWDVEYYFNDELGCVYITAKKSKSASPLIFVPISASDRLSFLQMKSYTKLNKAVILAMVESDSTCVYYQVFDGIGEPPKEVPGISREEKRIKLDGEVRKNRKLLEHSALYGIPITLTENNMVGDKT